MPGDPAMLNSGRAPMGFHRCPANLVHAISFPRSRSTVFPRYERISAVWPCLNRRSPRYRSARHRDIAPRSSQ